MLLLASGGKDTNCTGFSFFEENTFNNQKCFCTWNNESGFSLSNAKLLQAELLGTINNSRNSAFGKNNICWKVLRHRNNLTFKVILPFLYSLCDGEKNPKKAALVNYRKELLKCHLQNKEGWMCAVPGQQLCSAVPSSPGAPASQTCAFSLFSSAAPKCCQGAFRPLMIIFLTHHDYF